jgi:hypothetical protein
MASAADPAAGESDAAWLAALLARNAGCAYLRAHGSPTDLAAYRRQLPLVDYEGLERDWMPRLRAGEAYVLFGGRPCAFELTGGSSGGAKLIPYSVEGHADFQAAVAPWLGGTVSAHGITGRVYLSLSPATRAPMEIGGIPVGLPDGAYLGEQWGAWVAQHSAVPLDLMQERSIDAWRERTLRALREARDLQLISVWSPSFLLRLLDDLPDPRELWPQLKVVSCWASAASRALADELRARLPHAHLQPKGLLSTECVVSVPDAQDRAVLNPHGFFEFEHEGELLLAGELEPGADYAVIATTASGLYRYRTGDLVRCEGYTDAGRPVLEFLGRCGVTSDLVGEKLVEPFVNDVLHDVRGFRFLAPLQAEDGYALVTERDTPVDLAAIEQRLAANPQYAYARKLGQLQPLRRLPVAGLYDRYVAHQVRRGVRLADVKPLALMADMAWIESTEGA